jgi:quercetin dioxygenase-like cupin family protein
MQIKHWTDVAEQPADGVEGVTVRWVINDTDGAPHFAMRVFDVRPGCSTPYHSHWWEHEVYVLDGEGVVVQESGETHVSSGTVILVDGDEKHCFRNTGDGGWLEGLAEQHATA